MGGMKDIFSISSEQRNIIQLPPDVKIFLEGLAGTGKTTVGVERMLYLMSEGVPGNSILVIVPQRTLSLPYMEAMNTPGVVAGGMVRIITMASLAQRMVDLFWPAVAKVVGFSNPLAPPIFLNYEGAQYYMAHLVRPLLNEGLFDSVTIDRNRIYGQILDNLNKAAIVGFSHEDIGVRLKSAWTGASGQARVYDDAQKCATLFREYCLHHNLLDFSLQVEIFRDHLWNSHICREYLKKTYQHLIVDNIEEDVPVTHDVLSDWLPHAESGLVIYDSGAGFRQLLGSDPIGAYRIKEYCTETHTFKKSYVMSPRIQSLASYINHSLVEDPNPLPTIDPWLAISHNTFPYFTQMLDWITDQVESSIKEEGIAPKEIVILAPILSDSLRFSLVNRLENRNIPVKSHRPSRSLRVEPVTLSLITLTSLAHPELGYVPTKQDFSRCLMQSIDGMDLIRSKILADIVYRVKEGIPELIPFDQIIPSTQERISPMLGEKYEHLRLWLEEYRQLNPIDLDYFLSRLFGEVLSQPGYGFHLNNDKIRITATLIESMRNFRKVIGKNFGGDNISLGREYIEMLNDGLVASQYLLNWQPKDEEAVLITPAYTYLINNYPVDVQLWVDVGNRLWAEHLFQPLTQPYVLNRNWSTDKTWSYDQELETNEQLFHNLVLGLINRCRKKIFLGISKYNEQGYEQRGALLQVLHKLFESITVEREYGYVQAPSKTTRYY